MGEGLFDYTLKDFGRCRAFLLPNLHIISVVINAIVCVKKSRHKHQNLQNWFAKSCTQTFRKVRPTGHFNCVIANNTTAQQLSRQLLGHGR